MASDSLRNILGAVGGAVAGQQIHRVAQKAAYGTGDLRWMYGVTDYGGGIVAAGGALMAVLGKSNLWRSFGVGLAAWGAGQAWERVQVHYL